MLDRYHIRFLREKEFTAASFADAVNHFAILGEGLAVQELRDLVSWTRAEIDERIGWICRVLFEPKSERLRPPFFGSLCPPHHAMPSDTWPLYPVVLSGSTHLVVSKGGMATGPSEDLKGYFDYCLQAGVFRKKPVSVPTRAQALSDAAALRQSAAWQSIKWKDSGKGWSYMVDEGLVWRFIQKQAEGIP
jgi:hypothetical protein